MQKKISVRSLTRLVIGAALTGVDLLSGKLEDWEKQAEGTPSPAVDRLDGVGYAVVGADFPRLPAVIDVAPAQTQPPPRLPEEAGDLPAQETRGERLSYAVTGVIFAGQERLARYGQITGRAAQLAGNWAELLGGPVYRSRMMRPLRRTLDELSERGQETMDRWVANGRVEAERSRRLANVALTEQVGQAIDYLTANEEVQELVQSQSAGLIDEVIEEARERTVSADNFLEAIVRSMLRRTPRWELPEPPAEIRRQVDQPGRQLHGRSLHK